MGHFTEMNRFLPSSKNGQWEINYFFEVSIQIKLPKGQSWVNTGIIANRWFSLYRDMKLIFKVRGQNPCLTEPPSQLLNAGIVLPPVKGMCYCLSLSTKALIHNWLPEPGGLEGSTNYGVDCSKTLPPSKDGESSSNLIPFCIDPLSPAYKNACI